MFPTAESCRLALYSWELYAAQYTSNPSALFACGYLRRRERALRKEELEVRLAWLGNQAGLLPPNTRENLVEAIKPLVAALNGNVTNIILDQVERETIAVAQWYRNLTEGTQRG